jgi:tetratricopeptide (TPR) repeat protein
VDTLSFTVPGNVWINLQWLGDVLMYAFFLAAGSDGLVLAAAGCFVAATALLIRNVRSGAGPWITTVTVAWAVLVAQERFAVRPEMFSFLYLQLLLWLLDRARAVGGRSVWLVVPLMVLWVNSHSLFIVGLFVLACAAGAALIADQLPLPAGWREATALDGETRRRLMWAAALGWLAALINPYFLRGALFPFELLSRFDRGSAFASIGEFADPFAAMFPDASLGAYQVWILAAAPVALLAAVAGAAGTDAEEEAPGFDLYGLATFVGLAGLSLLARRNAALFVMGTAPFVARCIALIWRRWGGPVPRLGPSWRLAGAGIGVAALLVATLLVAANRFYRADGKDREFGLGVIEGRFPIHAAAFVESMSLPGPMYNDLTTGGYLAWTRPTGEGVYIDGRLEVYDEFFTDYRARLARPEDWSRRADALGIQSALLFHRWRNRYALISWLEENPDWQRVYQDETAMVWVRAAGNGERIAEARAAFPGWERRTSERLLSRAPSWFYPAGTVRALDTYALLLNNLGRRDDAALFFARSLEHDLPARLARENALWMADYHRRRNELERARTYIERAAEADPDDADVRTALSWLRQVSGDATPPAP